MVGAESRPTILAGIGRIGWNGLCSGGAGSGSVRQTAGTRSLNARDNRAGAKANVKCWDLTPKVCRAFVACASFVAWNALAEAPDTVSREIRLQHGAVWVEDKLLVTEWFTGNNTALWELFKAARDKGTNILEMANPLALAWPWGQISTFDIWAANGTSGWTDRRELGLIGTGKT
jgi:hypothetical protein